MTSSSLGRCATKSRNVSLAACLLLGPSACGSHNCCCGIKCGSPSSAAAPSRPAPTSSGSLSSVGTACPQHRHRTTLRPMPQRLRSCHARSSCTRRAQLWQTWTPRAVKYGSLLAIRLSAGTPHTVQRSRSESCIGFSGAATSGAQSGQISSRSSSVVGPDPMLNIGICGTPPMNTHTRITCRE